jgi:hypothetical protein
LACSFTVIKGRTEVGEGVGVPVMVGVSEGVSVGVGVGVGVEVGVPVSVGRGEGVSEGEGVTDGKRTWAVGVPAGENGSRQPVNSRASASERQTEAALLEIN